MNLGFYELDPFVQDRITQSISPSEYRHTIMQMKEEFYTLFMKGVKEGRYGRDAFIAMGFIYANPEEYHKDFLTLHSEIVSEFSKELGKDSQSMRKEARDIAEGLINEIPALAGLKGKERIGWAHRFENLLTQLPAYAAAHN